MQFKHHEARCAVFCLESQIFLASDVGGRRADFDLEATVWAYPRAGVQVPGLEGPLVEPDFDVHRLARRDEDLLKALQLSWRFVLVGEREVNLNNFGPVPAAGVV